MGIMKIPAHTNLLDKFLKYDIIQFIVLKRLTLFKGGETT
ncbi:MAG: hypothetical protein RHS_5632 [Robinsoniella sp. RHS]|nr:MAG: hypothetical protein RHS_5632 [Robinsoniella sp. RHS]